MLVVEVDRIDAEALQAGVAGGTHIRGASVEAARVRIGLAAHDAKFCGEKNFVSKAANRRANQNLVIAGPVNVRGIEEGDAQFDRAMDLCDRFPLSPLPVKFWTA